MKKFLLILVAAVALPSFVNAADVRYGASVSMISHSILSSDSKRGYSLFAERDIMLKNKNAAIGLEAQTLGTIKGVIKNKRDKWDIYEYGGYLKLFLYERNNGHHNILAFVKAGLGMYNSGDKDEGGNYDSYGYSLGIGVKYVISNDYALELAYLRHTADLRGDKSEKIAGTLGIGINVRLGTIQGKKAEAKDSSETDQEIESNASEEQEQAKPRGTWKNDWPGNSWDHWNQW